MDKEEREIKWKSRSLQALYLSGGQSCHLADGFDRQVQCLHPSGIRLLLFHAALGKTFLAALLAALHSCRTQYIILNHNRIDMFIISQLFCLIHVIIDKFTTGFLQSRSLGVGMNHTCLEIFNPLLKGRDSHFVELVHANKEILRKDLGRQFTDNGVLLFGAHLQKVARVDTHERVLTVVKVISTTTDIKVEDTEFANLVKSLGFTVDSTTQSFETIQPRFVFRLDVEGKTEDEVFGAFASKHRYNIRVAKKKGVEVKICGPEAAEDFHKIMIETGKRDDFGIRSTEYFRSILENFGEDARIYLAYYEGQPIAGSLAIHYGDKVWYLYGASSNEHRNVMPNYLVQWEMIRWAIETGCRIYDFRGVSGYLDESNPLYGIYRFKKGFSGELTEFIGEMNLVIKPFAFQLVTCGEKVYKKLRTVKRKLAEKK